MAARAPALLAFATLSLIALPAAADDVITIDGEVPSEGPDHFFVPFDVPEGTAEIEVRHDDLSEDDILDWGLYDTKGFRGWGGGNPEPAIVGVEAASRSYLPGPIPAGEWKVVVGKAKIESSPAVYHLEIVLRDAPTLPPQPERAPYAPSPPLETGARWYAGDFHVHSRESGDARPALDEIAAFARERGLDFVEISDHNTVSHLELFADAQARNPDVLFLPGVEFTTYAGHANGIGATVWVDHKIGLPGVTIEAAADAFEAQGAVLSINHPKLALGELCIGCAWEHDLDPARVGAIEIATGGLKQSSGLFTWPAIAYWDELCAKGLHVAAVGGSDDHRAGEDLGAFQSPIGDPTTMVFAEELSAAAIVDAVRRGRTVVKLQGPDDPMVELTSDPPAEGDTVAAQRSVLRAKVTGGKGAAIRFVHDGAPLAPIAIDEDPFVAEVTADPPAEGESRWRAEVLVDDQPRTITSHLWLRAGSAQPSSPSSSSGPASGASAEPDEGGCACAVPGHAGKGPYRSLAALGGLAALLWRGRARDRSRAATVRRRS